MSAIALYQQVAAKLSAREIARRLGLHPNTIQRWEELGRVPQHYCGDFKRMLGRNGDAEDQFYTKPKVARQCYRAFQRVAESLGVNLRRYRFIEPAAGCGRFYRELPPTRRIGVDLHPRDKEIVRHDYLRWRPEREGRYIVIGNPPFGLRGHLALQFINHSAEFADMVAFILPQLFESDGKGVPSKRVHERFRLAHSERIPSNSFEKPDGTPVEISTIFQVWSGINHGDIALKPRKSCAEYLRIYSLSDGGAPASTRNKHMIGACDLYLPSTCFRGMKAYRRFEDLPNQRGYGVVIRRRKREIENLLRNHDWTATAFPSTNGALNLRRSLIEDVVAEHGFYDGEKVLSPQTRRGRRVGGARAGGAGFVADAKDNIPVRLIARTSLSAHTATEPAPPAFTHRSAPNGLTTGVSPRHTAPEIRRGPNLSAFVTEVLAGVE